MTDRIGIFLLGILTLASCGQDKARFEDHRITTEQGLVAAESWKRGHLEYQADYDQEGNLSSLLLEDGNVKILINVADGQMCSYQIQSHHYRNTVNLEATGEVYNSEEIFPGKIITRSSGSDEVLVETADGQKEPVDFMNDDLVVPVSVEP